MVASALPEVIRQWRSWNGPSDWRNDLQGDADNIIEQTMYIAERLTQEIEGESPVMLNRKAIDSFQKLLQLHACDQEGISIDWLETVQQCNEDLRKVIISKKNTKNEK